MKVAIITLPLHTNYGGLLQAYALKKVLEMQGHSVTVLDREEKMPAPKGLKAPLVYAGRMLRRLLKGSGGPEVFREKRYADEFPVLSAQTSVFVKKGKKSKFSGREFNNIAVYRDLLGELVKLHRNRSLKGGDT